MQTSKHGGDVYRNDVEIDFSVNINPFGVPEKVKEALKKAADECMRYPDDTVMELSELMSECSGVSRECILFGNGASELFWAIIHAVKPQKVLIPVPSFSGYKSASECEECEVDYYYMKEEDDFLLTDDFLKIFKEESLPNLIFLANPNNPTGKCIDRKLLECIIALCCEKKIWLVLDECFIEFTERKEESLFKIAEKTPYLVVVRAFTKIYGIPGVRLGYLAAEEKMINLLKRHIPEWNVSIFAQYAGAAALKEVQFVEKTVKYVKEQRAYMLRQLKEMGIKAWFSEADYILIYSEKPLYEKLLEKKILIRDCSNYKGLKKGYYRIAIKTEKENEKLIEALRKISLDDDK